MLTNITFVMSNNTNFADLSIKTLSDVKIPVLNVSLMKRVALTGVVYALPSSYKGMLVLFFCNAVMCRYNPVAFPVMISLV
jgi:hypothetical protein